MISFEDIRREAWTYVYGMKTARALRTWLAEVMKDPTVVPPKTSAYNLGSAILLRLNEHARLIGYSDAKLQADIIQLLETEYHSFEPPFQP